MADAPNTERKPGDYATMGQPAHDAPETASGRLSNLSIDIGGEAPADGSKPKVRAEPDHGLAIDIEGDKAALARVDSSQEKPVKLGPDGKPLPADPAVAVTEEGTKETPPAAETTTEPLPKLPAFEADKPESVEAFSKAFMGADGKSFNMANLSADWQANAKVDPKTGAITGNLSEDTYKFLESKGIDRATVKAVEEGQVARLTMDRNEVFTQAGGQDKYLAATDWARKGGYDAAAAAKFNADLNAGGQARKDAVDLLMQRFTKANPPARRVSPQRSVTDNAGVGSGEPDGGVKPYEKYSDYQADLRKARQTADQKLLNETRARLKVSPWYGKQ